MSTEERYQVVVHVDAAVLADPEQPGPAVLERSGCVSGETSRRLACDASRVVMRHDEEGRVVEVGARTRTSPPAIRRALNHRDRGCRFPGCGSSLGEGHHVRHWANGGPTTLSNLVLLCRRHHRAVHEEGYQVLVLPALAEQGPTQADLNAASTNVADWLHTNHDYGGQRFVGATDIDRKQYVTVTSGNASRLWRSPMGSATVIILAVSSPSH